MKKVLFILSLALLMSCSKQETKKQIVQGAPIAETGSEGSAAEKDSESKLVPGLPFKIDSATSIIFPVGEVDLTQNYRKSVIKSGSYSGSSMSFFAVGSYSNSEFYGFLDNLIFEDLETGKRRLLTQEKIKIKKFSQLRDNKNSPLKYLLFQIISVDTNKDGELNENDLVSLYVSSLNGENLVQISKREEELIDWTLIDKNLLYFRTIEDSDKNGELDHFDALHIYRTDLRDLKTEEVLQPELNASMSDG